MTFLAPWTGVAVAAGGVGLLTLLYVLKLRRTTLRVGSVMLWERALADVEVNTPWKRLRIDWLYALQVLAILALAGAAARPALGIGSDRQRVVILIDRSASMAATDGDELGRTRLEVAKEQAAELIENLHRARQVEAAVAVFAGESRVVQPFTSQRTGVIEAIQRVEQTDEAGDLAEALQTVATLTAGDALNEELPPTVAYIFSDGGFSQTPVVNPSVALVRLLRVGPSPLAGRALRNAGIVSIAARRDEADPTTLRVVLRMLNTQGEPRDATVRFTMNDTSVGTSTVSLNPGEHSLTFPLIVPQGGVLKAQIANSDTLETDNTGLLVIDGPGLPSIVVVAPGAGGRKVDPLVLNFATSVNPAARTIGIEGLAALPAGVDLLVLDRVSIPLPGRLPAVPSVSIGAGVPQAGIELGTAGPGSDRVVLQQRDHPLMRDVVLDGLVFDQQRGLTLSPSAMDLAQGRRGALIAVGNTPDGVPRVATVFTAADAGWGSDLSFVVFMGNAVDTLTLHGRSRQGRQIATGSPITVRVGAALTSVAFTPPGGPTVTVPLSPAVSGSDSRLVTLTRAARAGVYGVTGAAEEDRQIAVNLADATESGIGTAEELPLRQGGGRGVEATAGVRAGRPREVWDWFVIAALTLLAVEWLAYATLARR